LSDAPTSHREAPPVGDRPSALPVGPWLLVVGMHRSGTSAVAGALAQLGLVAPAEEDRPDPMESNPDHWESLALGVLDDELLEQLGGTWDAPPAPGDRGNDGIGVAGEPERAASTAFREPGPLVWKDPRACLLLPYWRAHLPPPLAAVFIWRSPTAVARSLAARDGMALPDGIALWERYNRSGLAGLVGIDTYVTQYESFVEDPTTALESVAGWLGTLDQFAAHAPGWDVARAAAGVSAGLRHQRAEVGDLLLPSQQALVDHLASIAGPHRPFDRPAPGEASIWSEALLAHRRDTAAGVAGLASLTEEMAGRAAEAERSRDEADRERRALVDEVDRVRAELETTRSGMEELRSGMVAVTDELAARRRELADVRRLYQAVLDSTSWRLTRPIRTAASLGRLRHDPPD